MKLDLGNPAWQTTLPPQRAVACDAPVAACAFSRDGTTVAFGLGDGRVRLMPADIKQQPAEAIAEPVHNGAVLSLIGDPNGDGFVSGGDDGRLLRLAPDGAVTEIVNQKGKWIDKLAAHRGNGAIAASVGKMALVVDKAHLNAARTVKEMASRHAQVRDLIPLGAYVAGADPQTDHAVSLYPDIEAYLRQGVAEAAPMAQCVARMLELAA